MNINIFVDMDGVLCRCVDVEEYAKDGAFRKLKPLQGNIKMVETLIEKGEYNVYILSSLFDKNTGSKDEKNDWLDKYLPILDKEHRIFVPYGIQKKDWVDQQLNLSSKSINILLDDYTENLNDWESDEAGNKYAIKMINDINNSKGSWLSKEGNFIVYSKKTSSKVKSIENLAKSFL